MIRKRKRTIALLAIICAMLVAVVFIGRYYLLHQIKNKLEERLHALRDSGYIVRYDSIHVDTKKNEVTIFRLSIKRDLDSALCSSTDFFSARFIKAEGFRLLPLLLKQQLHFHEIELDSSRMVLYENFFQERDSTKQDRRTFSIKVDRVKLPHLIFSYRDSSSCNPNTTYTSNAVIEDFILLFEKARNPYYNVSSIWADSIDINLPADLYSMRIKEARLDLSMGFFDLDTLRIIPHLNKVPFGQKKGKESDRIEGMIPYINLHGLSVYNEDSLSIQVKKMTTQLFLRVFRDKRLPFKNNYKPLPVEALYMLPFGLSIDSLIVNKSFVEYEEFAEEADSSGRVFFDDLYASIRNISNTDRITKGAITMSASANFMGQGDLYVKAIMPWNPQARSRITGHLRNMDLRKLNLIMEPQIKVRAESGHLTALTFQFGYNDERASGDLELNYTDLKLVTFKTDEQIEKKTRRQRKKGNGDEDVDEDKIMKAPFKTFLVNTFIIRKNMDGSVPEEKRTGNIDFNRDKRRSIFNFWAKSMFSGIKSAYNLEKMEDSRLKKMLGKKNRD